MKAEPKPRQGHYLGAPIHNQTSANGTWLEGEEFAYPHGNLTRRCRASCQDGQLRVIYCGIPDTYFSIPARARINGQAVRGFVTHNEETGFQFTHSKGQK